jgi:hypothetical protein
MSNPRQDRAQRSSAAGGSNSSSDYVQALNYYINTALNKEPTQRQKEAVDRLNADDAKEARADAREAVRVSESKSASSSTVPTPKPRPKRAPELPDYGPVKPAPSSRLTDKGGANSKFQNKEAASRVVEKIVGSDSSRPLIVDTKSKKPIAKRIMEALGDKRSMEQASEDARVTKEMEMEREMNVAGRKKGGMVKKKKAPVKKAYGGMVKKKQGGSANKVNMKAGFTRRGCVKG